MIIWIIESTRKRKHPHMNEGRTLPSSFDVMAHVRQNVYDHPPSMDYISVVFKE
jgi:hypothetical protein